MQTTVMDGEMSESKTITQEAPPKEQAKETEPTLHEENRYETFLRGMKRHWRLEKAREVIRETDADYISTFTVGKGALGKVMELFCPESKAVSLCGKSQAHPYFFTMRCFDESGREQSPSTKMNFKAGIENGGSPLWKVSYGSLKRYYFPDGIFLSNGTKLELEVINPDTDIDKVEVAMEADVFGEI